MEELLEDIMEAGVIYHKDAACGEVMFILTLMVIQDDVITILSIAFVVVSIFF